MKKYLWLIFVCSLVTVVFWQHKRDAFERMVIDTELQNVEEAVNHKLDDIENKLNGLFAQAERSVDDIANELSKPAPDYAQVLPAMMQLLAQPRCTAVGTHFAADFPSEQLHPHFADYRYSDEQKVLYAPFLNNDNPEGIAFPYDYTVSDANGKYTGWYSEAIDHGRWYGPYFGSANSAFVISYSAPIRWNGQRGSNLGNVVADFSLENLRGFIADIQLLDSGYGIIAGKDGTIISHPVKEYLGKNISEIEELKLNVATINNVAQGRFHDLHNNALKLKNQRKHLVYIRDFGNQDWTIIAVLNKVDALNNLSSDSDESYLAVLHEMDLILVVLWAMSLFCLCLVICAQRPHFLWYASGCFSIICLSAIILIWDIHLSTEQDADADKIVVLNKTELEAALNSFDRAEKQSDGQVIEDIKIKTGFYIQSTQFTSANDVYVTGYVWQKLPVEWESLLAEGENSSRLLNFVLPEAQSASIEVVYSDKNITRWYFEASLRQAFNYRKYPFDDEDIWIRAHYSEFYHENIILVPDFDAYPSFVGADGNGLEGDIFIEGWDIKNAYYFFQAVDYSSNFGAQLASDRLENKPELFFNISVRRDFLGVFIAYMIPLGVVAYLLFAVSVTRSRDIENNERYGFKSANVLTYSASLFFVLIFSHMSLRETLQAKGIIYLEYFFFILYCVIGIVAANATPFFHNLFSSKNNKDWVVLLYWPLILSSVLTITIMRFS